MKESRAEESEVEIQESNPATATEAAFMYFTVAFATTFSLQ